MAEATSTAGVRFGRTILTAVTGDLAAQPVAALVQAANRRGLMGTGLAGSLRLACGPEVEREAMEQAPLPLGGAIATTAGRLTERGVVLILHAVISNELGGASRPDIIGQAVGAALHLADERRLRSVAMPVIGSGTGPGQVPPATAIATIVAEAVAVIRRSRPRLDRLVFVSRSTEDVATFTDVIALARERLWIRTP